MKLRYIVAALLAILMLSFFGCVPEKLDGAEESSAETTTYSSTEATSAETTKGGGVFGGIQEQGTLPSISFDEFT
ncbi:MAG: hypothetical protein J6A83_01595 [Clostridia bacterium]|nr:hypothetical protein [Clostridia bacterium]